MYNRFAEKRRRYLREHKEGIYTGIFLTGKLEVILKKSVNRHKYYLIESLMK